MPDLIGTPNAGGRGFTPQSTPVAKPAQRAIRAGSSPSPAQAQPTYQKPSYTVTTTSGKQYTLDNNQAEWIRNRYKSDWAGSYGYDDADQLARKNGQMSAKVRSTYGNSNVDRQLAELGLPSEKNLEKYISEYQQWHTGGIRQVIGDSIPANAYSKIGEMYKQNWSYEDTAEDQARKAKGLMPSALASKYTDTQIDDELMLAGLPSLSEFSDYLGKYNNYAGIENLYTNAAGQLAYYKLNGIKDDDEKYTIGGEEHTGKEWYAKAFYDELGRVGEDGNGVYSNIIPLLKKSTGVVPAETEPELDPTKSYIEQMDELFAAQATKAAEKEEEPYSSFSYDDFMKNYDDYYNSYWKDAKLSNGQTMAEAFDVMNREQDAEKQSDFYDIRDAWFDGDKGIDAFINRYMQDYPDATPEQMFTDMYANGVSDSIVGKVMRKLRKGAVVSTPTEKNRAENGWGFKDIGEAYARAKQNSSGAQEQLWNNINYDPRDVEPTTESQEKLDIKERVNAGIKSSRAYIDEHMKHDAEDEATINATADAIKTALGVFFDNPDEGIASGDVDSVLKVLHAIEGEGMTNPVAMQLALEDLGFVGGFSGFADDLTAGWSEEDKRKLLFDIGAERLVDVAPGDRENRFASKLNDLFGVDLEMDNWFMPTQALKYQEFQYALEWAEEQVATGQLSRGDAYQILAAEGFQPELQQYMPEEWQEAHFKDVIVPEMFKQAGGTTLAMWDGLDAEQRTDMANMMWDDMTDEERAARFGDSKWWMADPTVYRTFGQALDQQFSAIIPGFVTDLVSGGVKLADMVTASLSGRPEMWDTTQKWMEAQQFVQNYGSVYDEVNGAKVASIAADVTQEIAKMYFLGSMGQSIGSSTKVGQALSALSEGANSGAVRKLTGLALDMLQSSPFVVSATAHNYSEAKALGATNGEATRYAILTGMAEGVLEGMNFDKLWGKVIGQEKFAKELMQGADWFKNAGVMTKAKIMSMVVSGLGEFSEESVGYVLETYLKMRHSDTWGAGTEWNASDWIEQAGMGFLTGFFGSGLSAIAMSEEDILTEYLMGNAAERAAWIDSVTGDRIWDNLTDAKKAQYEAGAQALPIARFKELATEIERQQDEYDAIDARFEAAKAELDRTRNTRITELEALIGKAKGADLTTEDGRKVFANKLGELGVSIDFSAPIASQVEAAVAQKRADIENNYNNDLANAKTNRDNEFNNLNDRAAISQAKYEEHFAAIHLMNEAATIYRTAEGAAAEMSNAYQNGYTYDPATRQASGEAADAVNEQAKNPARKEWFPKDRKAKAEAQAKEAESRAFTEKDEQAVIDVANKLKYRGKITFIDDADKKWNGKISLLNGDIVINKARLTAYDKQQLWSNPAMWILEHELNHYMKSRGSKVYSEFYNAVVNTIKNSPQIRGNSAKYKSVIDGMIADREKSGLGKLTRAQAEEEIVGNFVMEFMFSSDEAIKALVQTNGNIGEQVLSWLRYNIDRAKLRRSKESWARDILDVERKYALALRETRNKPQSEASLKENKRGKGTMYADGWTAVPISYNESGRASSTVSSGVRSSSPNEASKQAESNVRSSGYKPGDYDFTKPFKEQVQDVVDGVFPRDAQGNPRQELLVGHVWDSAPLKELGFSNVPVTYSVGHVNEATAEDADFQHKADVELLAQLPEAIKHPVAVIKSGTRKDSVVIITPLKRLANQYVTDRNGRPARDEKGNKIEKLDKNGNPIPAFDKKGNRVYDLRMAAIKLDASSQVNGRNIDSLHVTSFYAKADDLLRTALLAEENGDPSVFYIDAKKASDFLARAGHQLPERYKVKDGLIRSINDDDSPVKGKFRTREKTAQFENWFGLNRDERTGRVKDPGQISLFRTRRYLENGRERVVPKVMYKVPGTNNMFTETPSGENDAKYYINANKIITNDFVRDVLMPSTGINNPTEAIKAYITSPGFKRAGNRAAIEGVSADGTKRYLVPNKGDYKLAEEGYGLYDRSIKNEAFSSADDMSLERLGEYEGVANPETGVTAEDDKRYMMAALAGDTRTAWEMVRDMFERNGYTHIYRGDQRPTGSYDRVDWDEWDENDRLRYRNRQMFGAEQERFDHENDDPEDFFTPGLLYVGENNGQDRQWRPFSYGREAELDMLNEYVADMNDFLHTDYEVDSWFTDKDGNVLSEYEVRDADADDLVPHYALYDASAGEDSDYILEEATPTMLARRVYEMGRAKRVDSAYFVENPLAGGVSGLYVKGNNVNETRGYNQNWNQIPYDGEFPDEYRYDTITLHKDPDTGARTLTAVKSDGTVLTENVNGRGQAPLLDAFTRMFGEGNNVAAEMFGYNEDTGEFEGAGVQVGDDLIAHDVVVDPETHKVYERNEDGRVTDNIGMVDRSQGYDMSRITNIFDGAPNPSNIRIMRNENLIKFSDPIIYDKKGDIVPLHKRGDETTNLMFSGGDTLADMLDRADVDENEVLNQRNGATVGEEAEYDEYSSSSQNQTLNSLLNRYGAQPQGREPRARGINVPNRTNDQNRISRFIRSLTESGKLTNAQAKSLLNKVAEEDYGTYIPTGQEARMEEARDYISRRQPLQAQQEFHDMVMQGKFGVKTNAIGLQLLSDAAARGDVESLLDIASDLQIAATEAGQSAQIFNVLKELKGVGSAWYMQKVVERMNSKYADRIKEGKMDTITVKPELMADLAKATTVDEIAQAEEAVAKDIARQLPLTWADRLSSWRYFSMLANPTTHVRNITGNVLMAGLNRAKDAVATGLERTLGIDQSQRAHAVLTQADKSTWGGFADASYKEQAKNLSGGGKLGFETFIKQNMRSFDTKWINALAQFNFKALEGEDIAFIRPAYKNALMQYMKAQGYTLNEKGQAGKIDKKGNFHEMSKADMNAAVDWASQQAWKATFRDASDLATMLNKLSKENAVSRLLVEGVMPFKKTPINIAKRGFEYSPAGIIMGTTQLLTKVKQGKMSAAEAVDNLASGITGTALMALGLFLAKAGVIRAGGEDKKKYETYLEDTGDQTYALKFGDASINMSSIAPATIPLFMGVALQEMINQSEDSEVDLSTITDVLAGTLNPFMEMSFMASLNSALKNYTNNGIGGALGNTILTAAQNYGSQYLPTLGGKIAQFVDPTLRSTKSDATSPIGGNTDYYLRSLAKKVPGATTALQPDVDVWGRQTKKDTFGEWALDFANKFILPTNIKVANRDDVDNELIRVVESTGNTDFLPSDGNKYFTVKGEKYTMNARQYAQFSQDRGQAAYAAIKEVMASQAYMSASDEERADMLNKAKESAYKMVNTIWKEKLGALN